MADCFSRTLTTGTDNLVGTAGDDKFNGVLQDAGATGTTTQPGDYITGGAGTDTLNISVAGTLAADYTISAVQTDGVEKVVLSNFENHATFNTIVATDLMNNLATVGLASSSATGDTVFTGLKNLVTAEMRNGAGDVTLTYNSDVVTGTTDAQTLTVSNLTGGTLTAQGIETITVNTELVKSTVTDLVSSTLSKIVVTGDKALTVTNAITANTVDALAFTGALTVKAGVNAAQVIAGGAGNDVVDANTNLGSGDSITGGLGTDTLKVSLSGANSVGTSISKGAFYKTSGFELIDVASTNDAAALDLTGLTGVTNVLAAANVGVFGVDGTNEGVGDTVAFTLIGVTYSSSAVVLTATNAALDTYEEAVAAKINTITGFSAVAGTNTVTITNTSSSSEAVEFALGAVTDAAGTDVAGGADPGAGSVAATGTTGYTNATFTNLAATTAVDIYSADAVNADLADASGSADVLSINLKTTTADKGFNKSVGTVTVTNVETINLSATGMSDFKTTTVGALTDVAMKTLNITGDSDITITAFTSDTGLATIDGSASTGDLILPAAGAAKDQLIKTGAGNDTIAMGAYLTNADTIDGGANSASDTIGTIGKDKLTATVTGLTATTGALNIANVERINLTNAGSAVINAASITGASEIAIAEDAGITSTTINGLAAGVALGLGFNGTANSATALGTITPSLTDATGTADSLTFNLNDTTDSDTNTATIKTSGIETVKFAYSTSATSLASHTITATDLAVANIVVSGSDNDLDNVVTLSSLNAATTSIDASAFKGKLAVTTTATGAVTVSATGTIAQAITTGAGADTITLAGNQGIIVSTIDGGAGTDTLNVTIDNAATALTSVSNIEKINITVGANKQAGFNLDAKAAGLYGATNITITGGDSLSTFTETGSAGFTAPTVAKSIDASTFNGTVSNLQIAAGGLNSFLTIKGGASTTDKVSTVVSTATTGAKVASMTGIETLVVTSTDGDAASSALDLTNVTGLVTVDAQFASATSADIITLSNLAAGVKVIATSTKTADNLVVSLASTSGTTDVLNFDLTATAASAVLNLDAAGIETLNITNKAAATTILLDGVAATSGSTTTVNVAGAFATTLTSMTSSVNVVNASTATGALTIAAADRSSSAMTITGGDGADNIAFKNVADVLTGGAGSDTLTVSYSAILGGIQVDLSATDAIVSLDGASNAAIQSGFENVNLSGFANFGAVVTGSSSANTIVGTDSADNITGGLGADIITGGLGNDAINLTETTQSIDTVVFSAVANNGSDTITGFVVASDIINVELLAGGNVSAEVGIAAAAASTATASTKALVFANGAIGTGNIAIMTYTNLTEVAAFLDAGISQGNSESYVAVVNDLLTNKAYVYNAVSTNAGAIGAAQITLVGTITADGALTTANTDFTV